MGILKVGQINLLGRAKDFPCEVDNLLRRARTHVAHKSVVRLHGEKTISCCVEDTEKVLAITEALWEYFREHEGL